MLERTLDRFSNLLLFAGGAFTFLMMAHVTIDVMSKWLLSRPLTGTLEFVQFIYMAACVFLPLGAVQRQRGQIMVEVFTHSMPPRALAGIDAAVGFLCAFFVGALAWQSGRYAWIQTLNLETTLLVDREMYIWYARWFPVLGLGCCALYFLLHALMDGRFSATGLGRPTANLTPEASIKGEGL